MTTTADMRERPASKCFRLRRSYLYVGVTCTVFFAAMGITSTVAALWNIDGSFARPILAALIFGTFWSGFTLLGAWVIAAYFRERLFLGNAAIVQHGIFRLRTLEVGEVLGIKWRIWPVGGTIIVRSHSEKIKIHLDNFTKDERGEVILFFRETLPEEIQENWSRFEECIHRPEKPIPRARLMLLGLAAIFIAFAGIFGYCWFIGLGEESLFGGIANVGAAIWCLWRLRFNKDRGLTKESISQG